MDFVQRCGVRLFLFKLNVPFILILIYIYKIMFGPN